MLACFLLSSDKIKISQLERIGGRCQLKRSRWEPNDSLVSLWESQSLPVPRTHVTCPLGWSVQIGYHSQPALQQAGLCYLALCSPHPAHPVGSLHLPPAFPSSDNLGCMAHILAREQWPHAKLFLKMQVSRSLPVGTSVP